MTALPSRAGGQCSRAQRLVSFPCPPSNDRTTAVPGFLTWSYALLAALAILFISFSAIAQEGGTVSGIVVSSWDGTPLSGVVVTVRGTTLAAQTGADGRYQLHDVPSGDQVLRFSKSGYAAAVVTDA